MALRPTPVEAAEAVELALGGWNPLNVRIARRQDCWLLASWLWAPWGTAIDACGMVWFCVRTFELELLRSVFVFACLGPPIEHHRSHNLPPMWIACLQRGGTKDEAGRSIEAQRRVDILTHGVYVWLGSALQSWASTSGVLCSLGWKM